MSVVHSNMLMMQAMTIALWLFQGDPGRPGRSGPPGPPGEKGSPVGSHSIQTSPVSAPRGMGAGAVSTAGHGAAAA